MSAPLFILSNFLSANDTFIQEALPDGFYTQEEIDKYLQQGKHKIVEKWECKDRYNPQETLVLALVKKDRNEGIIQVAGVTYESMFSTLGFERRWDFPLTDVNYAFIIEPNGTANYYDFSNNKQKVKPSIFMRCELQEP